MVVIVVIAVVVFRRRWVVVAMAMRTSGKHQHRNAGQQECGDWL
jgi:hypothetical protein